MQNMNNKGLSDIVAAVLLIMIGVAAVFMVYVFVKDNVSDLNSQLSPIVSCLELQENPFEILDAVYLEDEGKIEATIRRPSTDQYVESIEFSFSGDGDDINYMCGPTCGGACNIQEAGQVKTFYFKLQPGDTIPERMTLLVNRNCEVDSELMSKK